MSYTVKEIAEALGATAVGDTALKITHAAEPAAAGPDALALAMDAKYADALGAGQARVAILWEGADWEGFGLAAAIFVPRPRYAMATLTQLMDPGPSMEKGIHPTALIDPTAQIGEGAAIGPFVVVARGAVLGRRARVAAHTSIGAGARIGDDALILEGVKIGAGVTIGDRVRLHPGVVLGSDGFSFVTPETSAVETVRQTMGSRFEARAQSLERIHSLGALQLGDDVEIGSNSTLDRGTIADTVVGSGTKIDNLVQIGHNAAIGRDCLLCGQSAMAGSSRLGDRVVVGGAASIADHVTVGDDAVIAGKSGVGANVPAGRAVMGYPAIPLDRNIEAYKAFRRLPRLVKTVEDLKAALSKK